jgi:hypothetical protein
MSDRSTISSVVGMHTEADLGQWRDAGTISIVAYLFAATFSQILSQCHSQVTAMSKVRKDRAVVCLELVSMFEGLLLVLPDESNSCMAWLTA